MDELRLKQKGWSDAEIAHARSTMDNVQAHEHENISFARHVIMWTMLIMGLASSAAASVMLFPLVLTFPTWATAGFFLLLGGCIGILITAALHSLQIHHKHHHHAMSLFVFGIIVCVTLVLAILEQRYGGTVNPLGMSMLFAIGIIIPYLASRRLHGR